MIIRKLTAFLLLFAIYLGMFAPVVVRVNAQTTGTSMDERLKTIPGGLTFRLSEAEEGASARATPTPAITSPLAGGETTSTLSGLPQIASDPDDKTDFAKRVGTLPAPKAGKKIPVKFPSDEMLRPPATDTAGDLNVIRYSPQGEVSLAPDLNVTFSQPMVAVSSQEQAAATVPVEMTPQVSGRWRWLGTRTLMFDTDKRFPMATKFTMRVPAGTRSANGGVLKKDVVWTFTTPAPVIKAKVPDGNIVHRDAVIYIGFDQLIDAPALLGHISLTAGGKVIKTRLATQDEINSNYGIAYTSDASQAGRWIAFRAISADGSTENALPADSTITVNVKKGTPSAEGPLTTPADQTFSFKTFGRMKFVNGYCNYRGAKTCSPTDYWQLEFTNAIDVSKFDPKMVKIEPAVAGVNIYPSGNTINISGLKKGRTKYKVTVDPSISDEFGQTLDGTASAVFNVGDGTAFLTAEGGTMSILDPSAPPLFSVYSTNITTATVRMYAVGPKDWEAYRLYLRNWSGYGDKTKAVVPGRLVESSEKVLANTPNELIETRIDISKALDHGFGSVILIIDGKGGDNDNAHVATWLQATNIGLDAFVDNEELVGFATDLKTGAPLSGVSMDIYPNGGSSSTAVNSADEDRGFIPAAWDWLTRGSGGPSDVTASEDDGSAVTVESIATTADVTPANGVVRMELPAASAPQQNMLVARRGSDVAFLPENPEYYWQNGGTWYKRPAGSEMRWFVFSDRGIYKPGEEVTLKGYGRQVDQSKLGDVEPAARLLANAGALDYVISDQRGNEIAKGSTKLNAFGAFDLKAKLADNVNLGYTYARFTLKNKDGQAIADFQNSFQIQEFRRPEFEVSAKVDTEGPYMIGTSANVAVDAKYYSGGGLANARTTWTVRATPTNYTPPNRSDFSFGTWVPWWGYESRYGGNYYGGTSQSFEGTTDAAGRHVLKIDFQSANPPRPYAINASAAVQDVNRQTWSSTTSLLVHPSSLYIGLKTPRTFVQKGDPINISSIVTDIDGNIKTGRKAEIKAILKDWVFEKGGWVEKVIDEQNCTVVSAEDAQNCRFNAKQGGIYTITATVMDDRERLNQSTMTIWVPGGKTPPSRDVSQQSVQLIPSQKEYKPGDTAELLVIAPFAPAEGILTLRRNGIVKAERFSMKGSSFTLKVPLTEAYLPNITAQVDLTGSSPRTDDKGEVDPKLPPVPAFAGGSISLPISIASRKLSVEAVPTDTTIVPGAESKVNIAVKNSSGEPVANSEVALVVVDESVLALTDYSIGDPISAFYQQVSPGVTDHHSRSEILLGNPADAKTPDGILRDDKKADRITSKLSSAMPAPAASAEMRASSGASNSFSMDAQATSNAPKQNAQGQPIALRKNFDALAYFSPAMRTDANGNATVTFKMPDNLTRYRVTAVAVDAGNKFGKGEANITARQPLMVRPSAPRFLNFGDKADIPVVIQNQTDKDITVDVAARATNAIFTGDNADLKNNVSTAGKRVVVKANDRAEIKFPVTTDKAGTARFQFAARSDKYSDAAEISLPVWTPATTEAFATYGTTDENGAIVQAVTAPNDVFPQFGGLDVTTSSTQLQELTDAFLYLTNYPYSCSEQIASRMISIAALKDVLSAFKAKDMPTQAELDQYFAADLALLKARQRSDGSFGLWSAEKERYEYPFLTVHVAHALVLAKAKGFKVPEEMITRVKPYLSNVEKHYTDDWYTRSPEVRWTISAYALYVRDQLGDNDAGKAKKLLAEATIEKMPYEALGWVLSVIAKDPGSAAERDAILHFLNNHTTETAATANFVTNYGDGAWLIMYSNRRADGVLLDALIKADPRNDLIPKLVRGLLDHRVKGAWSNTQENVFILLALDRYFNTFEKVTPEFVTKIWLGGTYTGEQSFNGRSIDSKELNIPMSYLLDQGGTSNLIIDKQGPGRLYYRIGMRYAPKNLRLDPADYGFTVLRTYEPIDDKADVVQNDDGSWTVKSGARVRVRLTMVAQARRYHVALVDQLPAGFEILNPSLATTEAIPADEGPTTGVLEYGSQSYGRGSWWYRQYWFEHQNFRDERAEAFASLLWEGVYQYSYVARATTPGQFVVPPAKAEEMYHPETFGRTGTDFLRVE